VSRLTTPLRIALWNVIDRMYLRDAREQQVSLYVPQRAEAFWTGFFGNRLDTMPHWWSDVIAALRDVVLDAEWFYVYNLLEFMTTIPISMNDIFTKACNAELERHMAAYRFVGTQIVEMTSELEIAAIEDGLKAARGVGGADTHLTTALRYLSDRESPDYRNSIKESISAVEAVVNAINGSRGTLGDALNKLDAKIDTHKALRDAFSKLYGYTSDAKGIRHALLEEPNLDQEDAKFMLVACAGFVNYLVSKAAASGIVASS
jgi:hypothetical protein